MFGFIRKTLRLSVAEVTLICLTVLGTIVFYYNEAKLEQAEVNAEKKGEKPPEGAKMSLEDKIKELESTIETLKKICGG